MIKKLIFHPILDPSLIPQKKKKNFLDILSKNFYV